MARTEDVLPQHGAMVVTILHRLNVVEHLKIAKVETVSITDADRMYPQFFKTCNIWCVTICIHHDIYIM